jgi:uncharacterized protein (DUF1330 family)
MPHEMLVALHVTDPARYARYRAAMTPLLEAHGGGFRYDFEIATTLRSEASHPINRVFAIHFPDAATSARFFADPQYLAVRAEHFEPAVAAVTRIAAYDR